VLCGYKRHDVPRRPFPAPPARYSMEEGVYAASEVPLAAVGMPAVPVLSDVVGGEAKDSLSNVEID